MHAQIEAQRSVPLREAHDGMDRIEEFPEKCEEGSGVPLQALL